MKSNTFLKSICLIGITAGVIAVIKKPSSVYKNDKSEQNPMQGKKVKFVADESEPENADGVRGHLEAIDISNHTPRIYEKYIKRFLDIILSFCGMIVLSPMFIIISLWIVIDDPGPVLFTQKRIGKDKQYFKIHNVLSRVSLLAQREQSDFSLHRCPNMAA